MKTVHGQFKVRTKLNLVDKDKIIYAFNIAVFYICIKPLIIYELLKFQIIKVNKNNVGCAELLVNIPYKRSQKLGLSAAPYSGDNFNIRRTPSSPFSRSKYAVLSIYFMTAAFKHKKNF